MFDCTDLTKQSRQAAADEVALASDHELLLAAVGLEAVRSAVELAQVRVLAEVAVRGITDRCFGLKTSRWVAAEAKVDQRGVGRLMRLGQRLRPLPLVQAAVADGEISVDHAAVLAEAVANPRVGEQIAAGQAVWVELAAETSFVDWRDQLRRTVIELDQDGGYDPNRDLARNKLRLTALPDGLVTITAELVGERALVVRQCVEAHADRLYLRLKRDHALCAELPMPTRSTVMAMALAELVLRGSTIDRERTPGPATDVTLVIEAHKPIRLERSAAADPGSGTVGLPTNDAGCEPIDVFDPLDPSRLVDRAAVSAYATLIHDCTPAKTPDGHHVHREVAECLLCDPIVTALIVDSLGVPLDLGREVRLANRQQRRALARRDGGCVFQGCDAPVGWCDAHHVTCWEHGGPTDITNLALLCRYHHGVSHRTGWTMTALADQSFTWTTPVGQVLHSQRHRGRSPTAVPA